MSRDPNRVDLPDGTGWPYPVTEDFGAQWTLRYGVPTAEQKMTAASVVEAYRCLVTASPKRQIEVLRMIRKAAKALPKEAP